MTDEEIKNNPSSALTLLTDKLTPEQFDFCVHERPVTALAYFSDKLTDEQKKYCKERTK